jgi:Tol biopolymer transport system component
LLAYTGETGHIAVMAPLQPAGSDEHIVFPASFSPTWSPDGWRLAYVTFQQPTNVRSVASYDPSLLTEDIQTIWAVDRDGSNRVQLSTSSPGDHWQSGFAWSPDGKWIAAVNVEWLRIVPLTDHSNGELSVGPSTLYLIPTDGSGEVRMLGLTRARTTVQWLPDGKHIVVLTSNHTLDVLDLDGRREARIPTAALDEWGTGFAVSAAAHKLAYLVVNGINYSLRLRPLDTLLQDGGGEETVLLEEEFGAQTRYVPLAGDLVWSPNGRYLMYITIVDSRVRLHLVRADGRGGVIVTEYGDCLEPIDVPMRCWPFSMRPGFSPDSKWIVYNIGRMGYHGPSGRGLYLVSVADALRGNPEPTKLPLRGYEPQWQP